MQKLEEDQGSGISLIIFWKQAVYVVRLCPVSIDEFIPIQF